MNEAQASTHNIPAILSMFAVGGNVASFQPFGSGHINDTFLAVSEENGKPLRHIVQRLNHTVFPMPEQVMENIDRVTRHMHKVLAERGIPDAGRRALTFVPSRDGKPYTQDTAGNYWRVSPFIEGTIALDELETDEQAYQAARAFGEFAEMAASLGGPRLHETIPNFHHTPKRIEALERAVAADPCGRAAEVGGEIEFARARANECGKIVSLMASGDIPERVTHNDTKINNVLLDAQTSEGLCVIDLDTTMPGSVLYDFGDMVRTAACAAREDEACLENVDVSMSRFRALVQGYLETARFLNPAERENLAFSGKLITLECGVRFLTDYLLGDTYFKTSRPGHNLDRCRNQFAFVRALEARMAEMEEVVNATM